MAEQRPTRQSGELLEGRERYQRIMILALPIIGGMVSQNVMNLVDTAMVGTLGDAALAGVGVASFANFMAIAFIMGLSAGVQAMSARRVGEEREDTAIPLNGGLLLALAVGIPWAVLLFFAAPLLFPFLNNDTNVIREGAPYLQMRLLAVVGVGMNLAFRGYWNGVDLSKLYMRTLILMHATNIALNYTLIFGKFGFPELGTMGAGLGTMISTYLGTAYYIFLGMRHARKNGFLQGIPDGDSLRTIIRLSVPAGIQRFFFAAGMVTLFWIIGHGPVAEVAAANVLVNLLLVALLPAMGFGMASATLVSQAIGRKQVEDAKRWAWDVCKLALVVVGLISLPGVFFPDLLLSVFIKKEATLAIARFPLQLTAVIVLIDTIGMVLLNSLLGAGDSKTVMVISIVLQWGLFLPLAYVLGPILGFGLLAIWCGQIGYRSLQSGVFSVIWQKGKWSEIKI